VSQVLPANSHIVAEPLVARRSLKPRDRRRKFTRRTFVSGQIRATGRLVQNCLVYPRFTQRACRQASRYHELGPMGSGGK
jgi:hypothetical protein